MERFSPCPRCACHVEREEAKCPFCGAATLPRPLHSDAPHRAARMSRGRWLALGSALSVMGCRAATSPEGTGESASRSPAPEADAGIVPCSSRSGYFTCGTNGYCDRSTQACEVSACLTYELTSCGPCPTCECLSAAYPGSVATCTDDGDGGITIVWSQGACYGAPPTRLERLS
jgi:hypothetical protein